jgi:hypothetical protein
VNLNLLDFHTHTALFIHDVEEDSVKQCKCLWLPFGSVVILICQFANLLYCLSDVTLPSMKS